ncbi:MAG: VOC family protein [Spirochaetaceae bacterium]|jgi:predicted lactoylglutathione lyase|nr:VOC family protein [Spirochaetaceae bacterium]
MKFTNICPVFLVDNIIKTTDYYVNVLGFKYAKHFDKSDNFATVYRDHIEIVLIEKQKGTVENNTAKYGNGYDAYIDTDTIESIDEIYKEYKNKKVKIIKEPFMTDYGSYEFAFQDIDGRNIGIGLIKNNEAYFSDSNYQGKK